MYQTLLCDAMASKPTRPETQKQDKIFGLLMPYSAKIRMFVSYFARELLCSAGNLQTPVSQRIRGKDISKLGTTVVL